MSARTTRLGTLGVLWTAALALPAAAAPPADGWTLWDAADEGNEARIDHSAWQGLLARFVIADAPDGVNRFRYDAVSAADGGVLDGYLETLQGIDPRGYRRAEQFAYWVNLYNALTVRLVLDHPGRDSIRSMGGGWFSRGPWDEPLARVGGEPVTLNDIEHRILRPIWRDHRVHYAVNCASIGCPNLAAEAYTGSRLDEMLAAAERAYVRHPRAVAFENGRLYLSRIYDWYRSDFGDSRRALLAHLAERAAPDVAERLRAYQGRIRYRYDWRLNAPR